MTLQKALRTAQHYFPGGRDRREALTRTLRRLRRKPHEPDFVALRYFPPGSLMLDVGANYGQSIASMRLMQPEANIVSYEPNADLAYQITELFRNDRRVTVQAFGLSDVRGEFDLFVPYYRGFPYPGLASLDEEEARSWLSAETLYFFRPSDLRVGRMRCHIETLDSQALNPYFIKIDVQGAEFDLLRGGQATLAHHQPILLIESPGRDPRIESLLSSLRYREFAFANGRFAEDRSIGTNSFFMTSTRQMELAARNPGLFRLASSEGKFSMSGRSPRDDSGPRPPGPPSPDDDRNDADEVGPKEEITDREPR
jgi:FkbM family methyltransferase